MGSKYKTEFNEIRSLGSGAFSTVFEVKSNKDNKTYAIKKIPFENEENVKADTLNEVVFLNELQSEYVVKFLDWWIENNYYITDEKYVFLNKESLLLNKQKDMLLHLQMELCPVTLKNFIQLITSPKPNLITLENYRIVCELFKQLLESVFYLHTHNPPIIHRDIKPDNIMLSNGANGRKLKLTDFGLSTYHKFIEESKTKYIGTANYRAPDLNKKYYDTKVDIYSVGMVMQNMFNLNFNTESDIDNEVAIKALYTKVGESCIKCVSFIPKHRPTCEQLLLECSSWSHVDNETTDSFNCYYTKLINSFSVTSRYETEFFEIRKLPMKNAFSKFFDARDLKNGKFFTIKKLPFDESKKVFALKEIEFLRELSNEFVVAYFDSWIEDNYYLNGLQDNIEDDNSLYDPRKPLLLHIQFEAYSISLDYFIKNRNCIITSDEFRKRCKIFVQILHCVNYIHQKNIIHRDLQTKNIILFETDNGYRVKLSEFILSTYHLFLDQSHSKNVGTYFYKAPELDLSSKYTNKVDIYNLGLIMLTLFNIDINSESTENEYDEYEIVSELIGECIHIIASKRPSCQDLLVRMNKWIN